MSASTNSSPAPTMRDLLLLREVLLGIEALEQPQIDERPSSLPAARSLR